MSVRLNKFLADSGCCSRRKADEHILAGDIKVNGQIVKELGVKIDPEKDIVKFKGQLLCKETKLVYYALNKPRGVISTAFDEQGRQTVVDLVPREPRVYPVGRLDEDSEGLIILTNDGELAQELTHPSFEHEKEYEVTVRGKGKVFGILQNKERIKNLFERGMIIDGKPMKADRVEVNLINTNYYLLNTVLHTGHNRQIRKMCAKIGLEVITLRRIRIGNLTLEGLNLLPGQYKEISKNQIL